MSDDYKEELVIGEEDVETLTEVEEDDTADDDGTSFDEDSGEEDEDDPMAEIEAIMDPNEENEYSY
jgi:hypothetical protein